MSELGRLLSEARLAKELSLADVEAVTRIRQKYLEALERGDFVALPRGATARGFLRIYAHFLGLDVDEALQHYARESGDAGHEVPIGEVAGEKDVDYKPLEVELMRDTPGGSWWVWVAVLLLLAALGGGAWWLASGRLGWNPLAAFGPELGQPAAGTPRASAALTPPASSSPVAIFVPSPTSDLLPLPTPTVFSTPTPMPPSATPTPAVPTHIAVLLRVSQRSWVRVTVDGKVVEEALIEAGQERTWEATEQVMVRTGNGAGVGLTLNNDEVGSLGSVGQVVERTWRLENGRVVELTAGQTAQPSPTGTGNQIP